MAGRASWGKRLLVIVAAVVVLGGVAGATMLELWQMQGPSMEPGIANGERIVATRFVMAPERGDIVVLDHPNDSIKVIKRIVALGGQTIEIRDGAPVVDGESLRQGEGSCPEDHEFLDPSPDMKCFRESVGNHEWLATSSPMPIDEAEITVPDGHVYVLGDRRNRSNDSRNLGPIPTDALEGTVVIH